jgi:predicted acyltransferase
MSFGTKEGQVGSWTKIKLRYLQAYLPVYRRACQKALHAYYIDGFTGKGTWTVKNTLEKMKLTKGYDKTTPLTV